MATQRGSRCTPFGFSQNNSHCARFGREEKDSHILIDPNAMIGDGGVGPVAAKEMTGRGVGAAAERGAHADAVRGLRAAGCDGANQAGSAVRVSEQVASPAHCVLPSTQYLFPSAVLAHTQSPPRPNGPNVSHVCPVHELLVQAP